MKIKYLMHVSLAAMLVFTCFGANAMDEASGAQIGKPSEKNLHTFVWNPDSLGTSFNMGSDGQLQAGIVDRKGTDDKSIEESLMPVYLPLSNDDHPNNQPLGIAKQFVIDQKELKAPGLSLGGYRILCRQGGTFIVEDKIEVIQCLFRSQSSTLKFVGKRIVFANSFFDGELLNTSLTLCPLASLNSRIEYIKIMPKESPAYITGSIDFTTFTIQGLIVTKSDVVIKMKG